MGRIPEFPEFCEVSLDLADELRPVLKALRPEVSEFTLANLYLFRKAHAYRLSRWGGLILVVGEDYAQVPYAFPPLGVGDVELAAHLLCDRLTAEGARPVLFPVPQAMAQAEFPGQRWRTQPDRAQADYVYLRNELAYLPGRKFSKRRNRLSVFVREQAEEYVYAELTKEHLAGCMKVADGWCEIRCSGERPSTYLEVEAAKEALIHRETLGLRGGVILVGGRVFAFCLGEELNPETFVVHFEKAEPGHEGLAQVINCDFSLHGLAGYTYVNREQDLGDLGLRQAKENYHPVFLVEKFRVEPL